MKAILFLLLFATSAFGADLDNAGDIIHLIYDGGNWREVSAFASLT